MRIFAIIAAATLIVSVNLWLALIWSDSTNLDAIQYQGTGLRSELVALRDDVAALRAEVVAVGDDGARVRADVAALLAIAEKSDEFEFRVEAFDDIAGTALMNMMGIQGWSMASCRRALTGEGSTSRGIYECVMVRSRVAAK